MKMLCIMLSVSMIKGIMLGAVVLSAVAPFPS
jgi:hypothetical protein